LGADRTYTDAISKKFKDIFGQNSILAIEPFQVSRSRPTVGDKKDVKNDGYLYLSTRIDVSHHYSKRMSARLYWFMESRNKGAVELLAAEL
jgi:hypothetical protein